jgi:DNA-binding transcriptional MerR regulator
VPDSLDIAEITRLTGLTSRALRFYEARGLIRPLRGRSGRRSYAVPDLDRIHQIILLKSAGLSLADIEALMARGSADFGALIDARIAVVAEQKSRLDTLHALLLEVKNRVSRDEPVNLLTFCALIRDGQTALVATDEAWQSLSKAYLTEAAVAERDALMPSMAATFQRADLDQAWQSLGARIAAALPLGLDDPAALAFVREWMALLAPFSAVATPAIWQGTLAMFDDVDMWRGENGVDPGFDGTVWRFIYGATAAAIARGDDIGPLPPWLAMHQSDEVPLPQNSDGGSAT